jgi:DNA-binding MarR family transcriptional regulator
VADVADGDAGGKRVGDGAEGDAGSKAVGDGADGPVGSEAVGDGAGQDAGSKRVGDGAEGDAYPFDSASAYPAAEIAAAWRRERPGAPVSSIEIVTPIWRLAKLLADDRRRVLQACGVDPATLDLVSVLRRAGPPYQLTTREIARRALVTAGAVSQRVSRAEREGLVERSPAANGGRSVTVTLTTAGHALAERVVDQVLGREAHLVAGMRPADNAMLAGLLDRLLKDVAERLAPGSGG